MRTIASFESCAWRPDLRQRGTSGDCDVYTSNTDTKADLLSVKEQGRNLRIEKTSAGVKHVLGTMEDMGTLVLKANGLGRTPFQRTLRCAANQVHGLAKFELAGLWPF